MIHKKKLGYFKSIFPIIVSIFFVGLFIFSILTIISNKKYYIDDLIVKDLSNLDNIFKKINKTAGILNFSQPISDIDFLNIEKFAGSMVGSMNLVYPKKWQGPYVKSNPTIQEKFYEIIKTFKGYYIVPPKGIKLSNKKIIGKDIIFNESADIEKMLEDPNLLFINNKKLAKKINLYNEIKTNDINPVVSIITNETDAYDF